MGILKKIIIGGGIGVVGFVGVSLGLEISALKKLIPSFGTPSFKSVSKGLGDLRSKLEQMQKWFKGGIGDHDFIKDLSKLVMSINLPLGIENKSNRLFNVSKVDLKFKYAGELIGELIKDELQIGKNKKTSFLLNPNLNIGKVIAIVPDILKKEKVEIIISGELTYKINSLGLRKKVKFPSKKIDIKALIVEAVKEQVTKKFTSSPENVKDVKVSDLGNVINLV